MSTENIIKRIIRATGITNIIKILKDLNPTDLQSLLIHLHDERSRELKAHDISNQRQTNRYVVPCLVPQNKMLEIDLLAINALPHDFAVVELSPLAPFGINSALTKTNQKKVMSTIRNLEVCADPTTSLILECALHRQLHLRNDSRSTKLVKKATSQRCVRMQAFDDIPGFTSHFRTFSLASVGRDQGSEMFEKLTLIEHITFYLTFLNLLSKVKSYFDNISLSFSDIRIAETIIELYEIDRKALGRQTQNPKFDIFEKYKIDLPHTIQTMHQIAKQEIDAYQIARPISLLRIIENDLFPIIKDQFPEISCTIDLGRVAGIGYYNNLCFKISARNIKGETYPLVDGGAVNWTQQLLNSKKERAIISGVGTELICNKFAT